MTIYSITTILENPKVIINEFEVTCTNFKYILSPLNELQVRGIHVNREHYHALSAKERLRHHIKQWETR